MIRLWMFMQNKIFMNMIKEMEFFLNSIIIIYPFEIIYYILSKNLLMKYNLILCDTIFDVIL